ncbi:hypothetical protein [Dactylosporangium salmoneum]|uniref:Uncharacterized protein n=1 Tax=Dactylosporangium salmoneum TaxID=53361 RepID=A0ABP5UT21_9ACTN
MAEPDPTRELIRGAYADRPFDADAALADVVRRAGRPPIGSAEPAGRRHAVDVRRRRGLSVLAVFGGVVVMVLAIGYGAGVFGGKGEPMGAPPLVVVPTRPAGDVPEASRMPTSWPSQSPGPSSLPDDGYSPVPIDLPSSCAVAWNLDFSGGKFQVGSRGDVCPPLERGRLLLLESITGNGLIGPGSARVWRLADVPDRVAPPFTFRAPGVDALIPGHYYEIIYIEPQLADTASPGADAWPFYRGAMTISMVMP